MKLDGRSPQNISFAEIFYRMPAIRVDFIKINCYKIVNFITFLTFALVYKKLFLYNEKI